MRASLLLTTITAMLLMLTGFPLLLAGAWQLGGVIVLTGFVAAWLSIRMTENDIIRQYAYEQMCKDRLANYTEEALERTEPFFL